MSYICDDELIKAAYEIPDLQISDLQKEGPYFLQQPLDYESLHFIQKKNKYESFYNFNSRITKCFYHILKMQRNQLSRAVFKWKEYNVVKKLNPEEFHLAEKLESTLRSLNCFQTLKVSRSLLKWKGWTRIQHKKDELANKAKFLETKENNLTMEIDDLNHNIKFLENQIANEKAKENDLKFIGQQTNITMNKPNSNTLNTLEYIMKIKKENNLLRKKVRLAANICKAYCSKMDEYIFS